MKKSLSLISRFGVVAATATAICCAGSAYAQNETKSASEGDRAQQTATTESTGTDPSRPTSGMAAVGAKPRKPRPGSSPAAEQTSTASAPTAADAQAGATTGRNAGGTLPDADRAFMMTAAKDGMREVHMGQMAMQNGQSPEIKKLGQTIMNDHTKANSQLMAIAQKKNVKLDTRHRMDKMSKKDMANFDQAWLRMMVVDHQKDIALYRRQAQSGGDPDLKAFARKTTPVLEKHLRLVQAAQAKMGGGAGGQGGGTSAGQGGTTKSR